MFDLSTYISIYKSIYMSNKSCIYLSIYVFIIYVSIHQYIYLSRWQRWELEPMVPISWEKLLEGTGCSLNSVFFEDFKIHSGLWPFSVSPRCQLCTQWQIKHQRCSRTGRVKKNHNILKNTIFNAHPALDVP